MVNDNFWRTNDSLTVKRLISFNFCYQNTVPVTAHLSTAVVKQRNRLSNALAVITNEYKAVTGFHIALIRISYRTSALLSVSDAELMHRQMRYNSNGAIVQDRCGWMWSWPIEDNITALLRESNATAVRIASISTDCNCTPAKHEAAMAVITFKVQMRLRVSACLYF